MARIRTIKPEFWDSPDTIRASLRARLLYIAMWNWADDYGIGDANPGRLINFAFPGDDIPVADFPRLLAEVSGTFSVIVYDHLGRSYYWLPTWEEHQRTEKRAKQRVPYPPDAKPASDQGREPSAENRGKSAESRGDVAAGTGEQGNRGTGEEGTGEQHAQARDTVLATDASFNEFWLRYPRKVGKPAARKAWTRAITRAPLNTILEGTTRYATDPNRDDTFTKHPGPWLNDDRWNDPPLPTRNTNPNNESTIDRVNRLRENTHRELNELGIGDTNGNTAWSSRTAISPRSA